ncbi:MAG: hypothetical protein PHR77_04890 [Kiritimatiellae bacterium]|nr:hypothetical protein [Kiritimatiellia bacterium]MDD5523012.1 hypothetical protein [Kiritimatiellia bacterium]
MNADLNPENVLKKYKLREPSSDLKMRIASATRAEWNGGNEGRVYVVDFSASIWRLAMGLAASLLIAVIGNSVNNIMIAPLTQNNQNVTITSDSNENADLEADVIIPVRIKLVLGTRQPTDVADFVKIREVLNRELEDANGLFDKNDKASLPGQWMHNLKSVSAERGRV